MPGHLYIVGTSKINNNIKYNFLYFSLNILMPNSVEKRLKRPAVTDVHVVIQSLMGFITGELQMF